MTRHKARAQRTTEEETDWTPPRVPEPLERWHVKGMPLADHGSKTLPTALLTPHLQGILLEKLTLFPLVEF